MATGSGAHWQRLWQRLTRAAAPATDRVTDDDIAYCYRLLLGREPDAAGWRSWKDLADRGLLNIYTLTNSFLASSEFQQRQQAMRRPHRVDLGEFTLFVRLGDFLIGATIARDRVYEPHVTAELRRRLTPGAVFVDVGANVGYFTMLAAALVGSAGRVIAFEPNTDNQELLAESIAANRFAHVEVRPQAATEGAGSCTLELSALSSNATLADAAAESMPGSVRVQTVALDDALGELRRIDVLKMDIEGAESRALRGMATLLRRHRPVILTEFSPVLLDRVSKVSAAVFLDQLRALDYQLAVVGPVLAPTAGPQSNAEIIALHARSGLTHLDLVATPRDGAAQSAG